MAWQACGPVRPTRGFGSSCTPPTRLPHAGTAVWRGVSEGASRRVADGRRARTASDASDGPTGSDGAHLESDNPRAATLLDCRVVVAPDACRRGTRQFLGGR